MRIIIAMLVLGVVFLITGGLGWVERLPRNSLVGLRTPATMASDESWAMANRVAGRWITVSGAALTLGSVAAVAVRIGYGASSDYQATLYAAGILAGVCVVIGAVAGIAAGRRVRGE
jgi:hypothetical protein